MKKGFFVSIFWLVCLANGQDFAFKQDTGWLKWKQKHDRSYESDIHELEKYVTWVSNNAMIEAHNSLKSEFGYTLAINQYGDMVRNKYNRQLSLQCLMVRLPQNISTRHVAFIHIAMALKMAMILVRIPVTYWKASSRVKHFNGQKD